MSIEQAIAANTAALIAMTAAFTAGGGAVAAVGAVAADTKPATTKPATTKPATTKPATKPKGPTREDMIAVLTKLKEQEGSEAAKAIVAKTGAAKMAQIEDDQVENAFNWATAALAGEEVAGGDDDI